MGSWRRRPADRKFKRPSVCGLLVRGMGLMLGSGLPPPHLYPATATGDGQEPAQAPTLPVIPRRIPACLPGYRLRLAPPSRPACTVPSVRSLAGRIPSPSNSKQAHLPRRRPRAERQLRLVVLRSGLLQVRKDLGNNRRLLDAGDDLQLPPQRAQPSISMPNTRFRRRAQFIATWRGVGGMPDSPPVAGCIGAPVPDAPLSPPRAACCAGRTRRGSASGASAAAAPAPPASP